MKKIKFSCPVILSNIKNHEYLNEKLLEYFYACEGESIKGSNGYKIKDDIFPDSFKKLDFHLCNDYERPWVKFFLPHLKKELKEIANSLWYDDFSFKGIWFEQYEHYDTHGWHIHANNYTGVYYVDMGKDSPKTEIIDPYNNKNITVINVESGSLLLFPSFFIHRSPPLLKKTEKTIVSFNLNLTKPSNDLFEKKRISYNILNKIKKIWKKL